MSAEAQLPSSNHTSTSCVNSNNDINVEAHNSNVSTIIGGSNNTVNQYQGVPPSNIPPERIEYNVADPIQSFTGRENVLQELHNAIEQNRENGDFTILALTNVVTGLGGIGKTETVKKYVQQHKATYDHVLWINAETHSQASDCIIHIATLTNLITLENRHGKRKADEEIAAELYNFICQKRALIVFDNANSLLDEDGESGIGNLLPRAIRSHCISPTVIVTSRNRKWNRSRVITLSGFEDWESYSLLIQQLQFQDVQENRELAKEIRHLCDGLPVVIQQVINVIKMESEEREACGEDAYSMQEFFKDYQMGSRSYIDERPDDVPAELDISYTVYKIFNLTFQKLSEKMYGELALQCLNIVSLLNPDGIPVELLLSFFDTVECENSIVKALVLLHKYNLLNLSDKCYTVHRMLQKVRIEILKNTVSDQANALLELIISRSSIFCTLLNNVVSYDNRKFVILENGMRLANLIFKENCGSNTLNFLSTLGNTFANNGKYYNAIYIYKTILKRNVCNTTEVRKYNERLANTCRLQGNLLESEQIYKNLLPCDIIRIPEWTCECPQQLSLIHCLAEVYNAQGKYGAAQSLLNYVQTQQKLILGPEHADNLKTKNTLAEVLKNQGKYKNAEELLVEVLNSQMVILGPEHPGTLLTKTNLAGVFQSQGKYYEAEKLLNEVLKSHIVILGSEHPDALTTKTKLSEVFQSQGKYNEAEELLNEVLKSQLVILNPELLVNQKLRSNLTGEFQSQGKYN